MSQIRLTDEQQAVVNHNDGPARVFAVAGAGKTTAMVHRVHRLVEEEIFQPNRILVSSFNRAAVANLNKALHQWPVCQAVSARTLHGLGNWVVREAQRFGYLKSPRSSPPQQDVASRLFALAVKESRQQNLHFKQELGNLDQEDFLAYVSKCKGKLHYADLSRVTFPPESPHRNIARPAEPPSEELSWYLDLYRIFEDIRNHEGWISFDDMPMMGWQLLVQHSDLLHKLQQQFDCIMVDEFQDVNRAQFGILDLLVRQHYNRANYMVIGDDDQTIYEWRGAEARLMLEAFQRYEPTNYQITDNFRCKASQITLANAVIQHNRNRHIKQLKLTQGFGGRTEIQSATTLEHLGRNVVNQVKASLAQGYQPTDIAILVRVYAQTPYIEQYLIKEKISYWGPNLTPFYGRSEILKFLAFVKLAQLEEALSTQLSEIGERSSQWNDLWNQIKLVPPIQYLDPLVKQQIQQKMVTGQVTLSQIFSSLEAEGIQIRTANVIKMLVKWIEVAPKQMSAKGALEQLDACLKYRDYLKKHSGLKETGQGKAAGIDAIIDYAQGKGNLSAFLDHLNQLQQQAEQDQQNLDQCIRLTTIHQAKGLEWPVVIVPHCNEGVIPLGEDPSEAELEEERRLLYVAMTRSKQALYLHLLQKQPISRFLQEAQAEKVLARTEWLHQQLNTDPTAWQARDVINLVKSIRNLGLERYFQQWWPIEAEQKAAIATTIQRCLMAVFYQDTANRLGLEKSLIETWQAIAPLQEPSTRFPGLESLLAATQPNPTSTNQKLTLQSEQNVLGKLKPDDRVEHKHFGQGIVTAVKVEQVNVEEIVTVNFQKYGRKQIQITNKFCLLRLAAR